MELLVSNPGIVMSAEQIYEKVWKEEAFQSENTVMVHIRKLESELRQIQGIHNILKPYGE